MSVVSLRSSEEENGKVLCVSANVRRLLPFLSISKRQGRESACFPLRSISVPSNEETRRRETREQRNVSFQNKKKMSNRVRMNARKNK